jgi:hypothetical protein
MSLLACPECDRHIRLSEATCPFCDADVGAAAASFAPRPIPTERMSRAAMMAFAAASLGAAACGGDTTSSPGNLPLTDAGPDGANMGVGGMPAYGAPPPTGGIGGAGGVAPSTGGQLGMPVYGAPFPTTGGAANNTGGVWGYGGAIYGAPPPVTGGAPNDGGASSTGGVFAVPPYGAPFPTNGGTANAGGAPNDGGASSTGGLPAAIYGAPFPPIGGAAPIPDKR